MARRLARPRDFDQLQIWSDGSGEEAVTGCITVDMDGAQKSSCKMVDWLGETPPLEPDTATVTKNDLTLVIALLPLARSF